MSKDRNSKEELAARGLTRLSLNVHPDLPGILTKMAGGERYRGDCIEDLIEREYLQYQDKGKPSVEDIRYDRSDWVRLDSLVCLGTRSKLMEMSPNKKFQGTQLTNIVFQAASVPHVTQKKKSAIAAKVKIQSMIKDANLLIDSIDHFEDSAIVEELAIYLDRLCKLTNDAKDKLWQSM